MHTILNKDRLFNGMIIPENYAFFMAGTTSELTEVMRQVMVHMQYFMFYEPAIVRYFRHKKRDLLKGDVYTESVISFAGFGYWREEPSDQPKVARGWTNLLWVVYPPRAHTHAGTTPPYTCMLSVVDHVIKMILPACKAGKVLGGFHMQAEMGQRMQPQPPLFPSLPQTPPDGQPQG